MGLSASLLTANSLHTIYPCATSSIRTLRHLCGSKSNLAWLLIGLVWFEGPKLTNCNVIINYQYQSSSSPANNNNNNPKATITTKVGVELDYKASGILNNVYNVNTTTLTRTTNVYNTGSKNTQHVCNNYQMRTRAQRAVHLSNINLPASASKLNILWREYSFTRPKFEHNAQSDQLRLESIKQQILSKLGLTRKPNVSHPLPKQFIWDTIYRADGINSFSDFTINHHHISEHRMHDLLRVFSVFNTNLRKQQRASPILKINYDNNFNSEDVEDSEFTPKYHHYLNEMNADTNTHADEDNEDFFGSTQEIITFAEKGE
uniref:Uncharacterized protein n=1 Tax=Glossina brevipalpis TaxID=37001 RepID=A0A1A9WQB9_9MUSC